MSDRSQTIYVVGLGSNEGSRYAFLRAALRLIAGLPNTSVGAASKVYPNAAVLSPDASPDEPRPREFLNMAVRVRSGLAPEAFMSALAEIEKTLLRVRRVKWGPRTIDLDVLWAEREGTPLRIESLTLSVPHPRLFERPFALTPMADVHIAADVTHALRGVSNDSSTEALAHLGPLVGFEPLTTEAMTLDTRGEVTSVALSCDVRFDAYDRVALLGTAAAYVTHGTDSGAHVYASRTSMFPASSMSPFPPVVSMRSAELSAAERANENVMLCAALSHIESWGEAGFSVRRMLVQVDRDAQGEARERLIAFGEEAAPVRSELVVDAFGVSDVRAWARASFRRIVRD